MQITDYWPIIAFCLGLFGWLVILTFRLGGIYSWIKDMKDNSGKISDGVDAKQMTDKHERMIGDIRSLCGMRGQQLGRLEGSMELLISAQQNLGAQLNSINNKIDGLSNAIINMKHNHE